MSILKDKETLCKCGNNIFRDGILTSYKSNIGEEFLVNIAECKECDTFYIIKSYPKRFQQFTRDQFLEFLKLANLHYIALERI